jgi:hypothetical protein
MGYCMTQHDTDFRMKAANVPAALAAIKADQDEHAGADSLSDVVHDWCEWEIEIDPKTGDVTDITFHGQKHIEDDAMFNVLGPFVEAGCSIVMHGEDGNIWRWYFDGEKCDEQYPRMVWDPTIIAKVEEMEAEAEASGSG